jgi:integrase
MPVLKLSKRSVDALTPAERTFIAFDSELHGFGVRVMASGVKTFIFEYRPSGGGRAVAKRRLKLGRFGSLTVDEAREKAKRAHARVELGVDPAAEKAEQRAAVTISGLINAFIAEHVETKCKEGTAEAHRVALEKLRAAYGNLKAESLTRPQLAVLHARMRAYPYAANRFLAVVSKAFNWAARRGLVPETHNPASRIERYRERQRERFLNTAELAGLGEALREAETVGLPWAVDETKPTAKHAPQESNRRRILDPYAVVAIRLLILTGARLREVLHAEWKDVDFERGIIHLPDSKTGAKPIYLSAAALEILASLPRIVGNPYVFPGGVKGKPRADLKKPWAAISKAAGLDGVRIHDLRHSFASFGAGASMGLPIIGKLLGHSQPATTARYAHLDADPMRRAVETIGATIGAALDKSKGGEVTPFREHTTR